MSQLFPWRKLQCACRLQGRSQHGTLLEEAQAFQALWSWPWLPTTPWGQPLHKGGLSQHNSTTDTVCVLMVETKESLRMAR